MMQKYNSKCTIIKLAFNLRTIMVPFKGRNSDDRGKHIG